MKSWLGKGVFPLQKRWFTLLSGIALAAMLMLVVGQRPVIGQDERDEGGRGKLAGTWNVTLQFHDCSPACSCPGIPLPALQMYERDRSILEVGGANSLVRGPGLGSWEHVGHHQFAARFKFFIFNLDGSRKGSEEITSNIELTDPDAFEANATFDLFDPMGNKIAEGCPIKETGTRFE